jgi:hypothetical protein
MQVQGVREHESADSDSKDKQPQLRRLHKA